MMIKMSVLCSLIAVFMSCASVPNDITGKYEYYHFDGLLEHSVNVTLNGDSTYNFMQWYEWPSESEGRWSVCNDTLILNSFVHSGITGVEEEISSDTNITIYTFTDDGFPCSLGSIAINSDTSNCFLIDTAGRTIIKGNAKIDSMQVWYFTWTGKYYVKNPFAGKFRIIITLNDFGHIAFTNEKLLIRRGKLIYAHDLVLKKKR